MVRFKSMTRELVQHLKLIVGDENVLTQQDEREPYSCDEMPVPKPHLPDVVVKPKDTIQIAKVLAAANIARVAVTPRGAGTGLSGGAVPLFKGIVLSLEKLNHIKEIDTENFVAVTEPGVSLADLYQAVERALPGTLCAVLRLDFQPGRLSGQWEISSNALLPMI